MQTPTIQQPNDTHQRHEDYVERLRLLSDNFWETISCNFLLWSSKENVLNAIVFFLFDVEIFFSGVLKSRRKISRRKKTIAFFFSHQRRINHVVVTDVDVYAVTVVAIVDFMQWNVLENCANGKCWLHILLSLEQPIENFFFWAQRNDVANHRQLQKNNQDKMLTTSNRTLFAFNGVRFVFDTCFSATHANNFSITFNETIFRFFAIFSISLSLSLLDFRQMRWKKRAF